MTAAATTNRLAFMSTSFLPQVRDDPGGELGSFNAHDATLGSRR
jgi:hypothetical protein